MATNPTMASPDDVQLMLYAKTAKAHAVSTAFRNIFVTNKGCSTRTTMTAAEKARRLRQINDDVGWMLSDELKLSRSLRPKQRAGIEEVFHKVLGPSSNLPEDAKSSVLALKQKWDGDNWGEDTEDEEDSHGDLGVDGVVTVAVRPPRRDHPIYGEEGIMHGVLFVRGNREQTVYRLNPRIQHKSARSFGHNGIPVGSWWPLQIVALHNGAHGARVAGIAGNSHVGAYSIVVSALYNELDKDEGDILYYSGSNSHDHDDPTSSPKATNCTKTLAASLAPPRRAVRVLRSGGSSGSTTKNRSDYAPSVGLRYDGLYEVVERLQAINSKGKCSFRYARRTDTENAQQVVCMTSLSWCDSLARHPGTR